MSDGLIDPKHSVQIGICTWNDYFMGIHILDATWVHRHGTGTPVCGGLSTAQALAIFRGFTGFNLIGMDIVEVAPAYDHYQITALAAAHIACDLICLYAKRKT